MVECGRVLKLNGVIRIKEDDMLEDSASPPSLISQATLAGLMRDLGLVAVPMTALSTLARDPAIIRTSHMLWSQQPGEWSDFVMEGVKPTYLDHRQNG